ncbi:DinB family protein [Paenibacillus athensensis]|uniref:DinB-like domain-containing protein n=1 Tax=Paenibacillus athensensis TaxID=1967502 RepID=A0A4Y8Q4U2_9BACL|nr:DinB family protein [Paenibacillus athensensis]MCD1258348.1 DinB family protein [Paenibacillus athensensis]
MNFDLQEAMELLERTPQVLRLWLSGLSAGWLASREGEGTWNPEEVVGHLIEAETTNWLPKVEMILREGESREFPVFDRFAHLPHTGATTLEHKLDEFQRVRQANINRLQQLVDPQRDLERTGLHPAFGVVKLRELLSTWVVHDLTHTSQIMRVMAERYREDVGPWSAYLSILKK